MYSLISGLLNLYFEKPTIKILIAGVDGVGKTHFLN